VIKKEKKEAERIKAKDEETVGPAINSLDDNIQQSRPQTLAALVDVKLKKNNTMVFLRRQSNPPPIPYSIRFRSLGSLHSTAPLRPIPYTTRPSSLFSQHSKALAQRQPLSTIPKGRDRKACRNAGIWLWCLGHVSKSSCR